MIVRYDFYEKCFERCGLTYSPENTVPEMTHKKNQCISLELDCLDFAVVFEHMLLLVSPSQTCNREPRRNVFLFPSLVDTNIVPLVR